MKTEMPIRWESLKLMDLTKRYGVARIQVYRWIHGGRMKPEIERDENGEYMLVTEQTLIDFDALGGQWRVTRHGGKAWRPNKPGRKQSSISAPKPIGDSVEDAPGIIAQSIANPTNENAPALGQWMLETIRKAIQREVKSQMRKESDS